MGHTVRHFPCYSIADVDRDCSADAEKHRESLLHDNEVRSQMRQIKGLSSHQHGREKVLNNGIDRRLLSKVQTEYPISTIIRINGQRIAVTAYNNEVTPDYPIDTKNPLDGLRPCIVLHDGDASVNVAVDYFEQLHVMGRIEKVQ